MTAVLRQTSYVSLILAGLFLLSPSAHSTSEAGPEKSRKFQFTCEATVKGMRKGQSARIWLPVPPSNRERKVKTVERRLPAKGHVAKEPKYGNEILFLEAKADDEGKVQFAVTCRVNRKEVKADLRRSWPTCLKPTLIVLEHRS